MKAKNQALAFILTMVMTLSLVPVTAYAADGTSAGSSKAFSDMRNDWTAIPLQNAVKNGLIQGSNGKIMPGEPLTRAQLAAMINRAFGAVDEDSLDSFSDVSPKDWYYSDMAKAVHMKTFTGSNGKLSPKSNITREEAFTVIARAFRLSGADTSRLALYSDSNLISFWAKDAAASLSEAGYIKGSNGKLNPKSNITRAEAAQLLDNMLKHYIKAEGAYSENLSGNVLINTPGIVLKNIQINELIFFVTKNPAISGVLFILVFN